MFIFVMYKDAPELSVTRRTSSELDLSVEKTLLVNPNCPVRIMLEYIRKKCKLASFTQFDLCSANGALKGLFSMPTYVSAKDMFHHKNTYYIIVLKQELDKSTSILPQLNHENCLYCELKTRVKNFLATGEICSSGASVSKLETPIVQKTPPTQKAVKKK